MQTRNRRITLYAAAILGVIIAIVATAWFAAPAMITHPSHTHVGPAPADLDAQDVTFPSTSGAVIHGWFIPGQPHEGAVLLLHGVRANRLMEIGRARFLRAAGYAVLAIDFRAHGESSGDAITYGHLEGRDVIAALTWLRSHAPGERIGVIGTSMGGAAFLLASPSQNVDAVVLEQVYPSIDVALDRRMSHYLGPIGHALSPVLLHSLGGRLGLTPDQLRPIDRIASLHAPLFLIGGGNDPYTSVADSLAMYAAARGPKQLWMVPGAGHVDLQHYAGMAYQQRILEFFGRTLRQSSGEKHATSEGSPPFRRVST